MGPIVVPQGQSDLTTNSCTGVFDFRAISRAMKPVTPLVASEEIGEHLGQKKGEQ